MGQYRKMFRLHGTVIAVVWLVVYKVTSESLSNWFLTVPSAYAGIGIRVMLLYRCS